ncbi:MAG: hypothetical protein KF772_04695 [Cryobacterium sp.]|nr:hypothetical protein [Cryobacterium sp.]
MIRAERFAIHGKENRKWTVPVSERSVCCEGGLFYTAEMAVEHLTSIRHLAYKNDLEESQLKVVYSTVVRSWASGAKVPLHDPELEFRILEPLGPLMLWKAGIHPDWIRTVIEKTYGLVGPLPHSVFLGLAYGDWDLDWFLEILKHRRDAKTADWLVWLEPGLRKAGDENLGFWLDSALSRSDYFLAISSGIQARTVREASKATGWTQRRVAREALTWAKVDCSPTVEHFEILARMGIDFARPSKGAIDSVAAEARKRKLVPGNKITRAIRTELGMLLEVLGTRAHVIRSLKDGVLTIAELESRRNEQEKTA